jgi:hypothetical protein
MAVQRDNAVVVTPAGINMSWSALTDVPFATEVAGFVETIADIDPEALMQSIAGLNHCTTGPTPSASCGGPNSSAEAVCYVTGRQMPHECVRSALRGAFAQHRGVDPAGLAVHGREIVLPGARAAADDDADRGDRLWRQLDVTQPFHDARRGPGVHAMPLDLPDPGHRCLDP